MDEREEKIRRLLQQGRPKTEIAMRLGIDRSTVSRVAARVGFPAQQRGRSDHDWAVIRSFYEKGHSAAECGRRFGFTPSTWDAAINRGEIVPRPRTSQQPRGRTRREVERLLNDGIRISEIAERLGVSKPTVCYHARRLGVPSQAKFARRFDWQEIQRVYDSGVPQRECRRRFGFSNNAWGDAVARGDIVPRSRLIPIEDLLVVGRPTNRTHLKARLIQAGLKQNQCEECGLISWRGKPFNMQLHHINGDGQDNRLENIALLCANCHAQTDTYGGRNGHRKPKPDLRLVDPPEEDGEEAA
jgi:DNA-binding CsgD family transcriptional regulator